MKKTILLGAILLAGVVSAFSFRTSCGSVVNVTQTEGYTMEQITSFLEFVNYNECGTRPKGITLYIH
ncbi:hypothetical protein J2795_001103 [Chryseobacterium bernardetii]|jgi:hypothetical protein|uniref:Uncharacterized protein n=2 Tax=Chryseobacterium TaxID=59732 RepID=A0A543EK74_9FLAO|nr:MULTISPECIES: hypothetical protein [Chryseobacterium]MDR6370353.1 hypothetical protein [Chryseobacterium vietnamense]MDR6440403.1 hypothetical protein [Chryseobacterium bernardetii]MDR6487035.1 hypothetical protein [Chryseobacterium vietnamense]TQM21967.1 hypothetical protein FB551_1667 [Chryseobacterium aquifrigidense]